MQERRGIGKESKNRRSMLDDFGYTGSMFQHPFGGRVPFDDPFFISPFGRSSRSDMFRTDNHLHRMQRPVIEEMDHDDDEPEGNGNGYANRNPIVEHPDDQEEDVANSDDKDDQKKADSAETRAHSTSFRRVTYGGINGTYYTATASHTTGSDGVTFEESKEADTTTGEASHRISRGIHNKGHSVTRKLDSDGKVNTAETLHNINEDELVGFDQSWKGSAGHLPSLTSPFGEMIGGHGATTARGGFQAPVLRDSISGGQSQRGKPKKVVTISIE